MAAQAIGEENNRLEALSRLIPHLPETLRELVLHEALAAARTVGNMQRRVDGLAELVPHLPEVLREQVLWEALGAAEAIEDEKNRVEALSRLVPHLPETLRELVLHEALAAAREIRVEFFREKALTRLAPYLPEPLLCEARIQTLEFQGAATRARALSGLAPHLTKLPSEDLYMIWRETLHLRAAGTRRDLLANMQAMLPIAVTLGNQEAINETFYAIQDIVRWWP